MEHVLLVVQVIIAAALIGMVLLQRSDSDGFGLGSGSGANFLSGRASANLLTRTTAILAALFIINSLVLSVLAAHHKPASIVDAIDQVESEMPPVIDKKAKAKTAEKSVPAVPDADVVTPAAPAKKAKPVVDATTDTDKSSE